MEMYGYDAVDSEIAILNGWDGGGLSQAWQEAPEWARDLSFNTLTHYSDKVEYNFHKDSLCGIFHGLFLGATAQSRALQDSMFSLTTTAAKDIKLAARLFRAIREALGNVRYEGTVESVLSELQAMKTKESILYTDEDEKQDN